MPRAPCRAVSVLLRKAQVPGCRALLIKNEHCSLESGSPFVSTLSCLSLHTAAQPVKDPAVLRRPFSSTPPPLRTSPAGPSAAPGVGAELTAWPRVLSSLPPTAFWTPFRCPVPSAPATASVPFQPPSTHSAGCAFSRKSGAAPPLSTRGPPVAPLSLVLARTPNACWRQEGGTATALHSGQPRRECSHSQGTSGGGHSPGPSVPIRANGPCPHSPPLI